MATSPEQRERLRAHFEHRETAWHKDRMEWAATAMRQVMLLNAGSAVAAAAFIGTTLNSENPIELGSMLFALGAFIFGVALVVMHSVYRFLWAEYRAVQRRVLRQKAREQNDGKYLARLDEIALPPTRPQIIILYVVNIFGVMAFFVGLWMAVSAIQDIFPRKGTGAHHQQLSYSVDSSNKEYIRRFNELP